MADRFPLIANSSSNLIQELASGDTLDLTGNNIDNAVNVKATGIVTFSNATDSTSSTTGAVIISGGVGIAKRLFVGTHVTIGGPVTYEDVTNVDSVGLVTARNGIVVGSGITLSKDGDGFFTGIVTATSFSGDGSELDGIAGFATAVTSDGSHFASDFYTATHSRQVPANTQYTVQGNSVNGNTVFTKLGQIHVAVGATFHVASGHNFIMNSMGVF